MKYVSTGWWNTVAKMTEEMNRLSANKMVRFTQILMTESDTKRLEWCAVIGYDEFVQDLVTDKQVSEMLTWGIEDFAKAA